MHVCEFLLYGTQKVMRTHRSIVTCFPLSMSLRYPLVLVTALAVAV